MIGVLDVKQMLDAVLELDLVKRCPLAQSALRHQRGRLDVAQGDGSVRIYLAIWFALGQIHATLLEQDNLVRDQDALSGSPQSLGRYSESAKERVERTLAVAHAALSDISGRTEFVPDLLVKAIEECTSIAWPEEWRIEKHKRTELAKFLYHKREFGDKAEQMIAHRAYHLLKTYRNPTAHIESDPYDSKRDYSLTPRGVHAYLSGVAELYELVSDFSARKQ